ncbi:hypothetical protein LCGC14_2404200 [marine sediment metagenome]|uniref:Electron transfer flavoprotein alpha/beta-subunit N-terminal domain-containing protein n=1 Tax=marine sediment metagenome TaxID=412755 RepID=A0A0F9E6Q1_9ZZZZ
MKILVCISHVPDTTSKINFTDNNTQFDTNGVQFVINPNDEFGLTRAMWFKEKQDATIDIINGGEIPGDDSITDDHVRFSAPVLAFMFRKSFGKPQGKLKKIFSTSLFRGKSPFKFHKRFRVIFLIPIYYIL